jgi:glucokinase
LIDEMAAEAGIAPAEASGVGISIAGFITSDGVVTATAHLSREWIGYNLKARLAAELATRYYFALDTPAPCLGEAYFGAGKGVSHFAYVTVSTGIGAGIIADGKYFTGGLGWAGGVGHIVIDEKSDRVCSGCGNAGCLETFAATQGIVATARELLPASAGPLRALAEANGGAITPRMVFEAAQQGDPAAHDVWRRAGHALGIGLMNFVDIVSPQRIVIGGGIAQAGDLLLEPARKVIRERAFPPQHRQAEVVQAALGDLSGIYGAAAMVFYDLNVNPPQDV